MSYTHRSLCINCANLYGCTACPYSNPSLTDSPNAAHHNNKASPSTTQTPPVSQGPAELPLLVRKGDMVLLQPVEVRTVYNDGSFSVGHPKRGSFNVRRENITEVLPRKPQPGDRVRNRRPTAHPWIWQVIAVHDVWLWCVVEEKPDMKPYIIDHCYVEIVE